VIPFLLAAAAIAAAAAPAPPPGSPQARYISCANDVKANPRQAAAAAQEWIDKGGGTSARQCLGMAHAALEHWPQAAEAFEAAAAEAERTRDPRRAEIRATAGSAWLAAGEAGKAKSAFDAALASGPLDAASEGDARIDRARAEVALDDLASARADLDKAMVLVPQQSLAWYLSAALAVKERDLTRAHLDIARAVTLSPNDASYLLEAGNIAGLSGEVDAAKRLYDRAARAEPDSEAGKSAAAALAANGGLDPAPAATPATQPQPR
jgi:tetratricopeptide (TPR) repeat protein